MQRTPESTSAGPDCSRRDFLQRSCVVGAVLALGLPLSACDSGGDGGTPDPPAGGSGITISGNTITLDLTKADTAGLASGGGFLVIASKRVIVINAAGTVRAFTNVCTHQGNPVSQFNGSQMICPTHNSRFDTSGARVSGEASGPLRAYATSTAGTTVTVTVA